MGFLSSLRHGLPLLSISDFEPYHSLPDHKKETLRCYALQIAGGNGFASVGQPAPSNEVRRDLAKRGFDPDDMLALRNYIIKLGLMKLK